MATTEVVVRGAVTPEGQLVLDEQPNVPPGRVEVIVRLLQGEADEEDPLLGTLKRIWADLDARGVKGRTAAEAIAEVRALRGEWDAHQEQLERLQDRLRAKGEERRPGGGAGP